MTKYPSNHFIISLLATVSTTLGCGVMPGGQASTRTFTVAGFSLPVAMAYVTSTGESVRVSGIAANKEGAQAFVQRLVKQTVIDVLESQARSAFLPDPLISAILSQLIVNVTYEPLQCQAVALSLEEEVDVVGPGMISQRCIIVSNTVTGICSVMAAKKKCSEQGMVKITSVSANHTSLKGTLSTTNIIMANWSRTMWQNVLNRAVRMLALGPFGSHFFSTSGTVDGN